MILLATFYFLTICFVINFIFLHITYPIFFRLGYIDSPGARKIHDKDVVLSGGIGIIGTLITAVLIHTIIIIVYKEKFSNFIFLQKLPKHLFLQETYITPIFVLAGGAAIWFSGIIDDLNKQKDNVVLKFITQLLVAVSIVHLAGIQLNFFSWDLLNKIFSVLWIIGITNSFNLLDNMDGLSAGIATISALVLLGLAILQSQFLTAIFLGAYIGSMCGFIPHNFRNKRKIFQGDSGALFSGYILGTTTLLQSSTLGIHNALFSILIPIIIFAIPICDTFSVILYRIINKKKIWVGDTNHLSHRLVRAGFSQTKAVFILYLLTFLLGLGSTIALVTPWPFSLIALFQSLVTILLLLLITFQRPS